MDGLEFTLGVTDVKDAFHRFKINEHYSSYFALPTMSAQDLGIVGRLWRGQRLEPSDAVAPCFSSLPMGHTWSLYFCQAVGEHLSSIALSGTGHLLASDRKQPVVLDKSPDKMPKGAVQVSGQFNYVYVDNLGVLGSSRK